MRKHIGYVTMRLLLAFLISQALVFSHVHWGETCSGDGQQIFGLVIAFALVGLAVATAYFVVGCIVHVLARRKSLRPVLILDMALAAMLISVLTVGGIIAHYDEMKSNEQVQQTQ